MTRLSMWRGASIWFVLGLAIVAHGQTFTTLAIFNGKNGSLPSYGPLMQGPDGNFYGTTLQGGVDGDGTVFRVTPSGKLGVAYDFCQMPNCPDGGYPSAGLLLATSTEAYGTTNQNGAYGFGTIFEIQASRSFSVVHSFDSTDGADPQAGLIQAVDGNYYGTTNAGGLGYGTVFRLSPEGTLTTLHNFVGTDGNDPFRTLAQGTDGKIYGVTQGGGANNGGTLFRITLKGNFITLYNFCSQPDCADGSGPNGILEGADGNFYGTTSIGGNPKCDSGCGTVFKATPDGAFATLYSFCSEGGSCPDGRFPYAGLIQATDGNFYGTTYEGGTGGTLFEITPQGILSTLHSFCGEPGCPDGQGPEAPLVQATNGLFYGTTYYGGLDNRRCNGDGCGTIFSLDTGLAPFIAFIHSWGKIGQTVGILGQGFIGTTSVMLNGVPANFMVVSDTYLTAAVPPGGTTGYVTVTTPNGVLTSNVPFHVIP